jgi:hypothetical protein
LTSILVVWLLLAAKAWAANFSSDLAPILLNECLTCHSAEKAKGGYRVHNFAAVLQAGKSKSPAVLPGKPQDSELFKRLTTHDEDDRMPQDDEALTPAQIELFREWIAGGAKLDRGTPELNLAALLPRTPHPVPPEFYRAPLPVLALAFARDGKQLATGGYHEVLFWNFDGELQNRVTNAPQRIHSIAFDPGAPPEKQRFAVAGGQPGRAGEVSIFENGSLLTNLVATADAMLTVAFNADGSLLAAGGADNSIRIFRTANWEPTVTIQQHADWVTSVAFNPDGTKVISASRDRTARIYDAESGELETTYTGHGAALFAAAFLSDDAAVSGGKEKAVHLWDLKEGKKQKDFSEAGGEILALIAADEFFFSASADEKVRQYSVKDRKLLRSFDGKDDSVYSISHHSGQLAAGTYRGVVRIWKVADGELTSKFVAAPLRPIKPVATVTNAPAAAPIAQ